MGMDRLRKFIKKIVFFLTLVTLFSCQAPVNPPFPEIWEEIKVGDGEKKDEKIQYPKDFFQEKEPLESKVEIETLLKEVEKKGIEEGKEIKTIKSVPRTVLVLWDSQYEGGTEFTLTHLYAEMPLNFLGLKAEYVDLQYPLPNLEEREDVLGILNWLPPSYIVKESRAYLQWLIDSISLGKKIAQIGDFRVEEGEKHLPLIYTLWRHLGVYPADTLAYFTYNFEVGEADPFFFYFEAGIPIPLPEFIKLRVVDPKAKTLLMLRNKNNSKESYAIAVINEKGAFIPEEYLIYNSFMGGQIYKKWLVNPFRFFKSALSIPEMPIPDPSTVAGRRAYFSHIDGDGWNNASYVIAAKGNEPLLSSEIILESIIDANPYSPVTVGPIAANLNLEWNGTKKAQEIAKKCLSRPQVEVGCHTYTHPFNWMFFKNYSLDKESRYLGRYEGKTWKGNSWFDFRKLLKTQETFYRLEDTGAEREGKEQKKLSEQLEQRYFTPRAYALKPFEAELEILGAIQEVDKFAPPGKRVKVYQWSGNTSPWADLIAMTKRAGLANINGGDPRFDFTYPSYAYVCALARRLGKNIQVYTCASNENLYTDLWTKNFYGFVTLPTTFERTETPIRIKAMNLYYHMYSGERVPSLFALFRNLSFIEKQKVIPIPTSLYCEWVDGFFSSEITQSGPLEWRVKNRKSLQTFRFDKGVFLGVDWSRSLGVIGQRHFQGSLYVYLDETDVNPLIALEQMEEGFEEPFASRPYLIESSCRVSRFSHKGTQFFECDIMGFGTLAFRWKVPSEGFYEVKLYNDKGEVVENVSLEGVKGELQWAFRTPSLSLMHMEVTSKELPETAFGKEYE